MILTTSEDETRAAARDLSSRLRGGEVLLLSGELGAGKTAFVKGLAEGLGIDPGDVSSPTFTLIHEYRGGRLTLFHADLYRLERAATADLGIEELGVEDGVLAVEWPERLSHALDGSIPITIEVTGEVERRITIGTDVTPSGSSALPS